MKHFFHFIALLAIILSSVPSCQQISVEIPDNSVAVTGGASHISCRNAQLSGKVNLPQATSTNLSFGVLYSTSSGVLLNSAIRLEAKQFDAEYNFTVETGVLEPETIYYYRSYIIQNDVVKYGQIQSFTTLAVSSLIKTLDAGIINLRDATLNASLNLTDCRYESFEYGFELAPEGGQTRTLISNNHADNVFSSRADNLTYNTKYSYAAYVKLDDKVYKGEPKTFSTFSIQASVTAKASDVKSKSAKISGNLNIQSVGSFSKSAVLYFSSSKSTLEGLRFNGTKVTLTLGSNGSYSETLSALTSSTAYNFVVVAKVDDVEFASQIGNFSTLELPAGSVDLGLSVCWASCNLGASKPTEYGGYYQWAGRKDVSDKYLDWGNCPYHKSSGVRSGWLKYNTNSSYGTVDNKTVLEAMDDAATVALGGNWRIPTLVEWAELELENNCSWTWTTIDGVSGYKVQSKKSGYKDKWIFLPAAGYRSYDRLYSVGSHGFYWSSSLDTDYPWEAYSMRFDSSNVVRPIDDRYLGHSVRPVLEY